MVNERFDLIVRALSRYQAQDVIAVRMINIVGLDGDASSVAAIDAYEANLKWQDVSGKIGVAIEAARRDLKEKK